MSKRLAVVAGLVALSLAMPGIASAAWSAAGLGSGATRALVMPTGPTPTISVTGRNVAVSWSAVTLPGGTSVAGYRVARYVAGTGVPATILSACTGTIAALTCTEAAVPPGTWRYGITPLRNAWTGSEGSWSSNAVVGSPTFSFSSSAAITALPSTRPGSLANFVTGETVQFRLDSPAGTLLTGSTTPSTIGAAGSATTSVTIPAGTTQGAHTVYAVGSGGSQASASITVDTVAPVVSAAAIGKTAGGLTGFIRQGGTYYVYAQVTDATSAVGTVTASVTNVTTGSTAVAMTAGSYSAGGVSYNYRSASLTANASLSAGSKAFTITAADANGTSGTTSGFSVTVDNTAPTATNVQTSNASGGTVGRAEAGDTMTLTYGETMEPNSIVAGWTGSSMSVTVRLVDGGAGNDQIQIYDSSNVTQLPLGSIGLGRTDYTTTSRTFTSSSIALSGGTVTITLGTASGTVSTAAGSGTMTWTPSTTATDRAGNACTAAAATESGGADREF